MFRRVYVFDTGTLMRFDLGLIAFLSPDSWKFALNITHGVILG